MTATARASRLRIAVLNVLVLAFAVCFSVGSMLFLHQSLAGNDKGRQSFDDLLSNPFYYVALVVGQSAEEEEGDNGGGKGVDGVVGGERLSVRNEAAVEDDGTDEPEAAEGEDGTHRRMNVLVLYPDDWRHDSVGKENPLIKTPFLDSLANEGMRFPENAVTTSICWQSRATLFSGQWASRHGSYKLFCPHFAKGKAWSRSWPALLQKDGYYVGHVGKWQYWSDQRGRFDWSRFHAGQWYPENGKMVATEDKAKRDAIDFLRDRPKDKPFALTVAFYPPKPVGQSREPGGQWKPKNETRALYENLTIPEPYNMSHAFSLLPIFLQSNRTAARGRWMERYRSQLHYQEAMKNIYALITQVDDAIRQIVDELKAQDLYNNTLIIFTCDNGMFHGSHGLAGKWYPYRESIRVPLIIRDPRMPPKKVGTIDDSFTLNVDLAETILGAAGLKPHERMQGRDISDLYLPNKKKNDGRTALEREPWRDEFFYEFTFLGDRFIPSSNALVRKKWKYIDWYNHNETQLFDLENDPMEFTDVKDDPANAAVLEEMRARLAEHKKNLTEPNPLVCVKNEGGPWSVDAPDNEKPKWTQVPPADFPKNVPTR